MTVNATLVRPLSRVVVIAHGPVFQSTIGHPRYSWRDRESEVALLKKHHASSRITIRASPLAVSKRIAYMQGVALSSPIEAFDMVT